MLSWQKLVSEMALMLWHLPGSAAATAHPELVSQNPPQSLLLLSGDHADTDLCKPCLWRIRVISSWVSHFFERITSCLHLWQMHVKDSGQLQLMCNGMLFSLYFVLVYLWSSRCLAASAAFLFAFLPFLVLSSSWFLLVPLLPSPPLSSSSESSSSLHVLLAFFPLTCSTINCQVTSYVFFLYPLMECMTQKTT